MVIIASVCREYLFQGISAHRPSKLRCPPFTYAITGTHLSERERYDWSSIHISYAKQIWQGCPSASPLKNISPRSPLVQRFYGYTIREDRFLALRFDGKECEGHEINSAPRSFLRCTLTFYPKFPFPRASARYYEIPRWKIPATGEELHVKRLIQSHWARTCNERRKEVDAGVRCSYWVVSYEVSTLKEI